MSGKKTATIIVTLIIIASLAVAISIWNFYQTYEPKEKKKEVTMATVLLEESIY